MMLMCRGQNMVFNMSMWNGHSDRKSKLIQNKWLSMNSWLVVDLPFEKYEFVSWDDYSQYMEK
jgi:hypothetical protein